MESRVSRRSLMRLDSTGEFLGKSRRFALSDQLFLNWHFVQNAQGFLESRFQLFDLRLSQEQIDLKAVPSILHTHDLSQPAMRLFADAFGGGEVEGEGFEAMPLFVFPGVIKFHFVILDYDFLGLQAVQYMAALEAALEFAPDVIVTAPLVLRGLIVAGDHAREDILQCSGGVVGDATTRLGPLERAVVGRQNGMRQGHDRWSRRTCFR